MITTIILFWAPLEISPAIWLGSTSYLKNSTSSAQELVCRILILDQASKIESYLTMAQLVSSIILLLHTCSCFPLLPWPWGQIMGSNAIFLFCKCSLLTLSRGPFLGKQVWHKIYYHKTTTEPLQRNPKKHIHKKAICQEAICPCHHAYWSQYFSHHFPAQSGNLEYGEDFSVLVNATKRDIFPPPACRPMRNGAPPKFRVH